MTETTQTQITPEKLLLDNHSQAAKERLVAWNEMESRGLLMTVWSCSDARVIIPDPIRTNVIATIAASGSSQPFEPLLVDPSSQSILLLIHHDGETFKPGQPLRGCGGLAARSDLEKNAAHEEDKDDGIIHYVESHVNHPDPLVQAGIRASAISRRARKTVLAATQDHLSGQIIPFGLYLWDGKVTHIKTAVLPHFSYQNVYNPAEIYKDGIPHLTDDELKNYAPQFLLLLREHRKLLRSVRDRYPDLAKHQKVQNPSTVMIKTSRRPKEISYPSTYGGPGTAFTIMLPRYDEIIKGQRNIEINEADIDNVLNQVEYPILHSVENFKTKKTFAEVNLVIIETPVLDTSRLIAKELIKRNWMKDWLKIDSNHKVILLQEYKGILEEAEWLSWS